METQSQKIEAVYEQILENFLKGRAGREITVRQIGAAAKMACTLADDTMAAYSLYLLYEQKARELFDNF